MVSNGSIAFTRKLRNDFSGGPTTVAAPRHDRRVQIDPNGTHVVARGCEHHGFTADGGSPLPRAGNALPLGTRVHEPESVLVATRGATCSLSILPLLSVAIHVRAARTIRWPATSVIRCPLRLDKSCRRTEGSSWRRAHQFARSRRTRHRGRANKAPLIVSEIRSLGARPQHAPARRGSAESCRRTIRRSCRLGRSQRGAALPRRNSFSRPGFS